MSIARDSQPRCALLLLLALLAPAATACGAGGTSDGSAGGTATIPQGDIPTGTPLPTEPGTNALTGVPSILQANFNTQIELRGGTFEEPVICQFVDTASGAVGPACVGDVIDGGRAVRLTTPLFVDLDATTDCVLTLRDGAGREDVSDDTVRIQVIESDVRTTDGSGNNSLEVSWGAAHSVLRLDVPLAYADAVSAPAGAARVSARVVSNALCAQLGDEPNPQGVTDLFWVWGQFLDHDLDLTVEGEESFPIAVPFGDDWLDPFETGTAAIHFQRSSPVEDTGTDPENPRRHANRITSFIDASNVYGSDAARATALRTLDGTGRLILDSEGLLPRNTERLDNAPSPFDPTQFLAGDVRANENVALTCLHTIFAREHNRVADRLLDQNAHMTGDEIYEAARAWVTAEMQVITYQEFLPLLLGANALSPYGGYDTSVDPSIGVLFSTAAYRFGHSMVSGQIYRLDRDGEEIADGHLSLIDAFFNPGLLERGEDVDPILRGIAGKRAQTIDSRIVDEIRNFLFGEPGAPGLDLASFNLQRGRDHGLPDYNTCRVHFGLPTKTALEDITGDADQRARLEAVYGGVSAIDVWVGALCEDPAPGAMVGELLFAVFREQFERLRDGDRFWYQRIYAGAALEELERVRLADVIRLNSGLGDELSDAPMRVGGDGLPSPQGMPTPRRDRGDVGPMLQNPFFR